VADLPAAVPVGAQLRGLYRRLRVLRLLSTEGPSRKVIIYGSCPGARMPHRVHSHVPTSQVRIRFRVRVRLRVRVSDRLGLGLGLG
jgi:hypothetical protein